MDPDTYREVFKNDIIQGVEPCVLRIIIGFFPTQKRGFAKVIAGRADMFAKLVFVSSAEDGVPNEMASMLQSSA
jgi:hypothetical protein